MMKSKISRGEIALFAIVAVLSAAANLPEQVLHGLVDRRLLLTVLTAVVVLALFRYLRLLLFMCVVVLAVGANLPETLAEALGISETVMLASLICLVLVSLMSSYFRMLPGDGREAKWKDDTPETRKAVLIAVAKGNAIRLKWLLHRNVEINFREDGASPLTVAATHGHSEIAQLLIRHGAHLKVRDAEGKTALEIAQARGHTQTARIIQFAIDNPEGANGQAPVSPAA